MEYKIEHGPVFTIIRINLRQGEQFRAEAGAMVSMSPTLTLQAKTTGKGFMGSIKAAVGGESFFASLFTAETGDGELVLAPSVLGDVLKMELTGNTIYAEGGAYLAGSPNLQLSTKGSFKAMISGEGLFLQKISGTGIVFLNSYGAVYEKVLAPGELYIVDTNHIIAFEESVQYKVKKAAKGLFSTLASGEGLVCHYTGPGKLWMQTRAISALAQAIGRYIAK
ncbi:MAG: TIGR00266 family protein [Candidatus Aminicenantes bacterium]|nr:MAG: TIGR00266 family protein [Candidatus Aminicenantes bacterium]